MAEATFVLKEPSSKEPTLIFLLFRLKGSRLKYSTGMKVLPKYWNEETQLVRENRQFPAFSEYNATIKKLRNAVDMEYRRLINDSIVPTPDLLRKPLDVILMKDQPTQGKALITFIEEFIESANKQPNTKKQYRTALKQLKEYQLSRKIKLDFPSINLEFYNDFNKFLLERDYSVNSIGTIIKNVKVFMNEAVERGLTDNLQFKSKRFKTMEENTDAVYLTIEEINKIYSLDLSDNPRLDRVRDLFLIGCHTGLRFSDLVKVRDENLINGNTQLKIRTAKTGEVVIIPLNSAVREILLKYNGVPPAVISNQKMNQYLKELALLAELNEPVLLSFTKGGKRVHETYPKNQLVTVHTARRSFATNAFLNGVPTISIMKITGHRTEKSFMKYIKISQEDNANKLIDHPFFK